MRSSNFAVLIILFSFMHARAGGIMDASVPQLAVRAPLTGQTETTITAAELPETTPAQIAALLKDTRTQNSDILVTTDEPAVIQAATQAVSGPGDKRLLRFIPIGRLAATQQKIAQGFSQYYRNVRNTVMHDRIGLTVLTITTGYDSFIWIHSASLDIHQKSSMVLMNLVMAAAFGLDRDLWSRTTGQLKHKFINTLDRFVVHGSLTPAKILSAQFLSNLVLSVGLQTARTGLLSLDHLSTAATSTEFWSTAMRIGALSTLTGFAWTELFGAIDAQANPVAKMMMKRVGEMRGLILCHLASISMVLQPEIYGHTPVITFVVHGAIGLIALANAHRLINWLESSSTVARIYKKIQTFENFINGGLRARPAAPSAARAVTAPAFRMCRSLFAG